jgi:Domain of unknown function (DUF1330)
MHQVDDVDRYRNEYLPRVGPLLKKHGAEVLVAGFDSEAAEGDPRNSTVGDPLRRHGSSLGLPQRPRLPAGAGDPSRRLSPDQPNFGSPHRPSLDPQGVLHGTFALLWTEAGAAVRDGSPTRLGS